MKKVAIILSLVLCTTISGCGSIKKEETASQANSIVIGNDDSNDNNTSATSESSGDTSTESSNASAAAYTPIELGDDLLSGNYKFDGLGYAIDKPLSQLLANGWSLADDAPSIIKARRKNLTVFITKGDVKIITSVTNESSKDAKPEDCVVTNISVSKYSEIQFELPGGIALGSNEEDVVPKLEKYSPKIRQVEDSTFYDINKDKYYVQVMIKSGIVTSMNISKNK